MGGARREGGEEVEVRGGLVGELRRGWCRGGLWLGLGRGRGVGGHGVVEDGEEGLGWWCGG